MKQKPGRKKSIKLQTTAKMRRFIASEIRNQQGTKALKFSIKTCSGHKKSSKFRTKDRHNIKIKARLTPALCGEMFMERIMDIFQVCCGRTFFGFSLKLDYIKLLDP